MEPYETRVYQFYEFVDSVGVADQGDRVALRHGRGFLFHILAMAFLGEFSYLHHLDRFRNRSGGE